MSEDTRFCKDCVHFQEGLLCHFCTSPNLPAEPIYGEKIHIAEVSRNLQTLCGIEGRFFEKKEVFEPSLVLEMKENLPWWKKMLKFVKGC